MYFAVGKEDIFVSQHLVLLLKAFKQTPHSKLAAWNSAVPRVQRLAKGMWD